jgi:hypothetical protein
MPFQFQRDDRRRRVVIALHGTYEARDILAAVRRHRIEDVWEYGVLYDLRELTCCPTVEEFRQFMLEALHEPRVRLGAPAPLAVVAPDPQLYGMARAYADLVRNRLVIEVFREWEEADRWLAIHTSYATSGLWRDAIMYERDDARRRIVTTMSGEVGLDEVLGIIDRQEAEGTWTYGVLSDIRTLSWQPSREEVHRVVVHIDRTAVRCGRPRGPVAIVAAEPTLFRRARLYSALGAPSGLSSEVFFDYPTAETWLDERLAG